MDNPTLLDGVALGLALAAVGAVVIIAVRHTGNFVTIQSPKIWRLSDRMLYVICCFAIVLGLAIQLGWLRW